MDLGPTLAQEDLILRSCIIFAKPFFQVRSHSQVVGGTYLLGATIPPTRGIICSGKKSFFLQQSLSLTDTRCLLAPLFGEPGTQSAVFLLFPPRFPNPVMSFPTPGNIS